MRFRLWIIVGLALVSVAGVAQAQGFKAGVAKVAITPREPMWMAGYSARNRPSEGVEHDLWAKSLVIDDGQGQRVVLVTLDICGIDRALSVAIRDRLQEKYGFDRAHVALACSHTHSGPVVGTNLITMYPLDEEQYRRVANYAKQLEGWVVESVGKAIDALGPVELAQDIGRCGTFAFNRRNNDQGKVPELREKVALAGPDDHDVPVLRVRAEGGKPSAIVFGLACHCTTLDYYKFCGDYAGFAQADLEREHENTIALFFAGCGADQNPLPRGTVEHAKQYGADLARSVNTVTAQHMRPVTGPIQAIYREIDLDFAPLPDRAEWERLAKSDNRYEAERAKFLLKRIEKEGKLSQAYPYPIQIWRFGDSLNWVFLGGEVVVDYAHRLKRNLGSGKTWVTAYANDVMAYIPSLRVLKEGGYEGGGAMVYYAQPGPWSERVEEQIAEAVSTMMRKLGSSGP